MRNIKVGKKYLISHRYNNSNFHGQKVKVTESEKGQYGVGLVYNCLVLSNFEQLTLGEDDLSDIPSFLKRYDRELVSAGISAIVSLLVSCATVLLTK